MRRPILLVGAQDELRFNILRTLAENLSKKTSHRLQAKLCANREDWMEWLTEVAEGASLADALILADCGFGSGDSFSTSYLGSQAEQSLAAEFVLSFPEAQFVFMLPPQDGFEPHCIGNQLSDIEKLRSILTKHKAGYRTWFDPTGVHARLKSSFPSEISKLYVGFSESRQKFRALAVDDERLICLLNGYSAYRTGARCSVAFTNFALLTALKSHGQETLHTFIVDYELAFSDAEEIRGSSVNNSWGDERVLLAVGKVPSQSAYLIAVSRTPVHLEDFTALEPLIAQGCFSYLPKPVGGVYDFVENAIGKLGSRVPEFFLRWSNDAMHGAPASKPDKNVAERARHTAPYGVHAIAGRLLSRARRLRSSADADPECYVFAALLAGEAKEMLGHLARTTALSALRMQMECELLVELASNAMPASINVRRRLDVLQKEATCIIGADASASAARLSREDTAALIDFLRQVVGNFRRQFAEAQQLEEADECLRRLWEYSSFPQRFGKTETNLSLRHFLGKCLYLGSKGGTSFTRLLLSAGCIVAFFAFCYLGLFWNRPPELKSTPKYWPNEFSTQLALSFTHSANIFLNLLSGPIFADEGLKDMVKELHATQTCAVAVSETVGADLPRIKPAKAEPTKAEPAKAEPAKAEPAKVEPVKVEPVKGEPTKVEPAKVNSGKVDMAKDDLSQVKPPPSVATPDLNKTIPCKPAASTNSGERDQGMPDGKGEGIAMLHYNHVLAWFLLLSFFHFFESGLGIVVIALLTAMLYRYIMRNAT